MIINHLHSDFMYFWSFSDFDLKILLFQLQMSKGVITKIVILRPKFVEKVFILADSRLYQGWAQISPQNSSYIQKPHTIRVN